MSCKCYLSSLSSTWAILSPLPAFCRLANWFPTAWLNSLENLSPTPLVNPHIFLSGIPLYSFLSLCRMAVRVSICFSIRSILSCIALSLASFTISIKVMESLSPGLPPWVLFPPIFIIILFFLCFALLTVAFRSIPHKQRQNIDIGF